MVGQYAEREESWAFQGEPPDSGPLSSPFPQTYTDAEWQSVLQRYNAMMNDGFLGGGWLYPYQSPGLHDPGKPPLYFDRNGTPSLEPPPVAAPTLLQQLYEWLNWGVPRPEPYRSAPSGPQGDAAPGTNPPVALMRRFDQG
jgi:hypothetical protein